DVLAKGLAANRGQHLLVEVGVGVVEQVDGLVHHSPRPMTTPGLRGRLRNHGISMGTRRRYSAYSGCASMRSCSSSCMANRMYAVHMAANTRCATVMVGAAQTMVNQPMYSGCRTWRYSHGVTKGTDEYGRPMSCSHTWRRPKRSKWLIRKVTYSSSSQPQAYRPYRNFT